MKISVESLTEILSLQKEKKPLIHCISSVVTMNDLSQGILSYNGKSIMASSIDEVGEITSKASGILINLGTLDNKRIAAMEKSLRIATRKNKPVVLDVVGADISFFRREIALVFLARYKIDVIKGNVSEIKALLDKKSEKDKETNGDIEDINIKENGYEMQNKTIKSDYEIRERMRSFSKIYKTILVATGEGNESYVTDGFSEFFISNGRNEFENVVGVNSILGGLISVGISVARTNAEKVQAVLIAIMTMGVSQELAYEKVGHESGVMSLKNTLIDEISLIDNKKLENMGKIVYVFKR
ncbi:MAG: hydroxyethylthiazole kinase [Terrisporobacter sp.]